MKIIILMRCCLFALFVFLITVNGISQNWLKLEGTEPPDTKSVNLFGFLQPVYYHSESKVSPQSDFRKNNFDLRRARAGVKGIIPGTNDKINYFVLTEWGRNGLTEDPNGSGSNIAVLTDASITLNYIPGARIRFGQFKTPSGIDGLKSVHVHEFVEFSDVYDQMLMERFGHDRSVGAFRDIGVQVFDYWALGAQSDYELAYAFMISNGNGINSKDNNDEKDLSGRVEFARLFEGSTGGNRENVRLGMWFIEGTRKGYTFDESGPSNGTILSQNRERFGLDFVITKKLQHVGFIRLVAESVWGNGWIYAPVFFNGNIPADKRFFTFDTSVDGHGVPHADLNAMGWYASIGYRLPGLEKPFEINGRYSWYNPDYGNDILQDLIQDSWTVSGQYFFTNQARLTLSYAFKNSHWDDKAGNLLAAQVTVFFK